MPAATVSFVAVVVAVSVLVMFADELVVLVGAAVAVAFIDVVVAPVEVVSLAMVVSGAGVDVAFAAVVSFAAPVALPDATKSVTRMRSSGLSGLPAGTLLWLAYPAANAE